MSEAKRYYSRVSGARYVFQDGHECFFPAYYYETADPAEIRELDKLTAKGNNPLIFCVAPGEVPVLHPLAAPTPGGVVARSAGSGADQAFAAAIAAAYAGGQVLSAAQLPGVPTSVLDKINAVLQAGANDGGELVGEIAGALSMVAETSPPQLTDPVAAALAEARRAGEEQDVMAKLGALAGVPANAAQSDSSQ